MMEFFRVLAMFSWPISDSKVSGLYFLADTINCSITRIVDKDSENFGFIGMNIYFCGVKINIILFLFMKNVIKLIAVFFITAFVVFAQSCDRNSDSFIELSIDNLQFDFDESTQKIVIHSSGTWTVASESEWIQISPLNGSDGDTVSVSVILNSDFANRTSIVTFRCGDAKENLEISQYGAIESSYVDLRLEDKGVSLLYNEENGILSVQYSEGDVPDIAVGDAVVLPSEYEYDIRVIKSFDKENDILHMETDQGNMCNLFRNIDFTLTTNPEIIETTKSVGRIITPSSIVLVTDNERLTVFNKSVMTRELVTYPHELFSMDEDYSGEEIDAGSWGSLIWQKFTVSAGLDAVFYFDFGEKDFEDAKIGDLKSFKYYFEGDVDVDMILEYAAETGYNKEVKEIIKRNVLPRIEVTFMVGNVPVNVLVDTHLGKRFSIGAEAGVTATSGLHINANARLGLEYIKDAGVSPEVSFENEFYIYDPTVNVQGSAEATAAFYPELEIRLYKFIGPRVELIPYLGVRAEAGVQASVYGDNYMGWMAEIFSAFDATAGLELDCGIFGLELIEPHEFEGEETLLYRTPAEIELMYPENGCEMTLGDSVEVAFKVYAINYLVDEALNADNSVVIFETEGVVNPSVAVADDFGEVYVCWTPASEDDVLKAMIVDANGESIDEVVFVPELYNAERDALIRLYHSTGGESWVNQENWCTDSPLEDWYGVSVDQSGHVVAINLENNNLSGNLDINLDDFVNLSEFNINSNPLINVNVWGKGNMSELYLSDCVSGDLYCEGSVLKGVYISNCDNINSVNGDYRYLEVVNCNFGDTDIPFRCSAVEVLIRSCVMFNCGVFSDYLTFESSSTSDTWYCNTSKELNIINSYCSTICSGDFNENTVINLQNATLWRSNWDEESLVTLTCTITGSGWDNLFR